MKAGYIPVIKAHGGLISAAFLLMVFSGFGQSVFIGVFLPDIQAHFSIDKTTLGSIYAAATICSAIAMVWSGKLLDQLKLRNFITLTLLGLALGCLLLGTAFHPLMLFPAFFCLRQFGQGLMTLSGTTMINRYIEDGRGRAQSIAQNGLPVHGALFPLAGALLLQHFGFMTSWLGYACFVVIVLVPFFWFFLRAHEDKTHRAWSERMAAKDAAAAASGIGAALSDEWTRNRVLKDWRFYALLSIMMIPPCFGTAVFFYQTAIAESLELEHSVFATGFFFLTIASVATTLIAGPVMDQYGEKSLLIAFPVFYAAGLAGLAYADGLVGLYIALALIGAGGGIMSITGGPLYAKMYGTKHFASIKSLNVMSMIVASALSPPLCGYMLDYGFEIGQILLYFAIYTAAAWVFILATIRKMIP